MHHMMKMKTTTKLPSKIGVFNVINVVFYIIEIFDFDQLKSVCVRACVCVNSFLNFSYCFLHSIGSLTHRRMKCFCFSQNMHVYENEAINNKRTHNSHLRKFDRNTKFHMFTIATGLSLILPIARYYIGLLDYFQGVRGKGELDTSFIIRIHVRSFHFFFLLLFAIQIHMFLRLPIVRIPSLLLFFLLSCFVEDIFYLFHSKRKFSGTYSFNSFIGCNSSQIQFSLSILNQNKPNGMAMEWIIWRRDLVECRYIRSFVIRL